MPFTIRQFEMAARATIEKKLRRSLKVLGPTGIGKSEVVHQIAKSYGMGVIDIRLLLWSLTDLKGVPYPDDTHTYTKWLVNEKKSYVDQLCEIEIRMREYLYNGSRNKKLSKLLQQLDYIK